MPQLPLQRASGIVINFHQAYQYWRPQLSSCQVDRGLEKTLSRSLERRNHGPSGWLSRKWKNKRRKVTKTKTVEISAKDARPGAGDTGVPTGWCQCQGEKATKDAGWERDQRRRRLCNPCDTPDSLAVWKCLCPGRPTSPAASACISGTFCRTRQPRRPPGTLRPPLT